MADPTESSEIVIDAVWLSARILGSRTTINLCIGAGTFEEFHADCRCGEPDKSEERDITFFPAAQPGQPSQPLFVDRGTKGLRIAAAGLSASEIVRRCFFPSHEGMFYTSRPLV